MFEARSADADYLTPEKPTTAQPIGRDNEMMFWKIAFVLLVLWLLGWIGFHLLGAAIHILLILAIICMVIALVRAA